MSMIDTFLKSASSEIGVSDDSARSATSGLLGMIRDKADKSDFSSLLGAIPGADQLLSGKSGAGGGAAGLLGKIGGSLGGGLGGKLGAAASVMGILQKSGLDTAQGGKLVSMFFGFAKGQAGPEVIERILGKVPELKKLVG